MDFLQQQRIQAFNPHEMLPSRQLLSTSGQGWMVLVTTGLKRVVASLIRKVFQVCQRAVQVYLQGLCDHTMLSVQATPVSHSMVGKKR